MAGFGPDACDFRRTGYAGCESLLGKAQELIARVGQRFQLKALEQQIRNQRGSRKHASIVSVRQVEARRPTPAPADERCYLGGRALAPKVQRTDQRRRALKRITDVPIFVSQVNT